MSVAVINIKRGPPGRLAVGAVVLGAPGRGRRSAQAAAGGEVWSLERTMVRREDTRKNFPKGYGKSTDFVAYQCRPPVRRALTAKSSMKRAPRVL